MRAATAARCSSTTSATSPTCTPATPRSCWSRARRRRRSSATGGGWAGRCRGTPPRAATSTPTSASPATPASRSASACSCATATASFARTSRPAAASRRSAATGRSSTSRRWAARRPGRTHFPAGHRPRRIGGGGATTSTRTRDERAQRVPAGRPVLGRRRPTRAGADPGLLPRAVRLGRRGPDAGGFPGQVLPLQAARPRRRRGRVAARRAAAPGGSVVGDPFDSPGGARVAVLADPSGAVFGVWQPGQRRGAQVVNEPGAWSMSILNTADPERAKAFYGDLFGWETETFSIGDGELTLWRVPGYVGGEPQQPVSREVVAAMAPPSDGPPRWSVDFWVADADGAAVTAAALGGEVLAGPYDVSGFRQAVLTDPHGAAFTVSQLIGP